MVLTPIQLIAPLLLSFLALAILIAAAFLLQRARNTPAVVERRAGRDVTVPMSHTSASSRRTVLVALALLLFAFVAMGRGFISLLRPSGLDAPQNEFGPVTRRVTGPSGAQLAIEESGPAGAPRLVFTHGWGADRRE